MQTEENWDKTLRAGLSTDGSIILPHHGRIGTTTLAPRELAMRGMVHVVNMLGTFMRGAASYTRIEGIEGMSDRQMFARGRSDVKGSLSESSELYLLQEENTSMGGKLGFAAISR